VSAELRLREAAPADADLLVEMMAEFYAEASYPLNRRRARAAFDELLRNPALGRIWILREHDVDAGYLVLTLAYSMEYGGLSAFIDDFYVRSDHRGRGLGQVTLALVRDFALALGVRALHLEVGPDNHAAQAVYRKAGFAANDRQLLTLQLESPVHLE
jgi:GNAT superfamily N-acetyltransferase